MNTVLLPWFTTALMQTVRDAKVYHRPPVPSEFVATGVLYGTLTALNGIRPSPLWGALGWGFLLAVGLVAYEQGRKGQGVTSRKVTQQEVQRGK